MLLLPEVWQEKPSGQPPETRVVRTVTRFGGMVRNAIQWLVSCANPWYGMARAVTLVHNCYAKDAPPKATV